jgi:hypothetical protein
MKIKIQNTFEIGKPRLQIIYRQIYNIDIVRNELRYWNYYFYSGIHNIYPYNQSIQTQ